MCSASRPSAITFPEEDTEEINVSNLPTVYRSIWETARKHDIDDAITKRIVAMYAYDIDLTKKISAGDSIEMLETEPDAAGPPGTALCRLETRHHAHASSIRFRTDDGTVDFFDPSGETGKRFLTRRPLQGGGRLSSRFGYRIHPIFHTTKLHTGVDLAAPKGTPIYASGDGVVEKRRLVFGLWPVTSLLKHVNGFETGYGHMSTIADGIKPGAHVRQGQIIGYVGSTGNSTGPHLHFEIKVNGRYRRSAERQAAARQVAAQPVRSGVRPDHRPDPRPDETRPRPGADRLGQLGLRRSSATHRCRLRNAVPA